MATRIFNNIIIILIAASSIAYGQNKNWAILHIVELLADSATPYASCRISLMMADIYGSLGDSAGQLINIRKAENVIEEESYFGGASLLERELSVALFNIDRRDEALNYIRRQKLSLRNGSRNEQMVLHTAGALAAGGEFGLAKTYIDSIDNSHIKYEIETAIAIAYVKKGMIDSANAVCGEAVTNYFRPIETKKRIDGYLLNGNLDDAISFTDSIKYFPWKGHLFYELLDSLIVKGKKREVKAILDAIVDTMKFQAADKDFWCYSRANAFVIEMTTIAVLLNRTGNIEQSRMILNPVLNQPDNAKLRQDCYPDYEFDEVGAAVDVAVAYYQIGDSLRAIAIMDSMLQYALTYPFGARGDAANARMSVFSGYISINMLNKADSLLADDPFYYSSGTELLEKYLESGQYDLALKLISKSTSAGSRAFALIQFYNYLERTGNTLSDTDWIAARALATNIKKDEGF